MTNTFEGVVTRRSGYAGALGFPTINIPLEEREVSGIYAAHVRVHDEEYPAVAYADQKQQTLEAHLLDYDGTLDGQTVRITLLKKLREDAHFDSEELVRAAIANDVAGARMFFGKP